MIFGIGIDAIEPDRIEKIYAKFGQKFLKKIFTEREIEVCFRKKNVFLSLASNFASKEAFSKAISIGFTKNLSWSDIEVLRNNEGKPYIIVHGFAKEIIQKNKVKNIFVSITNLKSIVIANVILEK